MAIGKFELNELERLKFKENPFLLYLDELQDPGNMGTIIRTSAAAGVQGILLTEGCTDIYSEKVVRSSMGSILRIPIYENIDISFLKFSSIVLIDIDTTKSLHSFNISKSLNINLDLVDILRLQSTSFIS